MILGPCSLTADNWAGLVGTGKHLERKQRGAEGTGSLNLHHPLWGPGGEAEAGREL